MGVGAHYIYAKGDSKTHYTKTKLRRDIFFDKILTILLDFSCKIHINVFTLQPEFVNSLVNNHN